MNLTHQIRVAKVQFIVATIDVDTLGVQHGAHRAIYDVNAIGF